MVGKVECIVYLATLLVGFLGCSVLKVDIDGAVKKNMGDFRFWIASDAWRVSSCFMFVSNKDSLFLPR